MAFMRDANNLNWAFVCANIGAADSAATTISAAADLTDGEVVVLDRDNGHIVTQISAGDRFKLAQRVGDDLIISPLFTFSSATAVDSVDAVQQVTTIGSNGTTTVSLDPASSMTDDVTAVTLIGNSYYVLIEKQDNDEANRSGYQPAITAQVKLTNTGAVTRTIAELIQLRLAELLREAIRKNDQLEACGSAGAPRYLAAEAIIVDGGLTLADPVTGGGEDVIVTFGSRTVTASANWTGVAVGDFLVLNQDCYEVADVSGATITLTFPYAGASETLTSANTIAAGNATRFTDADADGNIDGVGIRLTGQELHEFDVDRHRLYGESRFNVRFAKDGEGVGTVTTGTVANNGIGDFRQVATDFYNSVGNQGLRWISDTPAALRPTLNYVAADGGPGTGVRTSSLINIAVQTEKRTLFGSTTAKQNVRLYIQNDTGAGSVDNTAGRPPIVLQTVFFGATVLS
jgi:hypothetical protein